MSANSEASNSPSTSSKLTLAIINLVTFPASYVPYSWGLALGAALGWLIFKLWGSRRKIATANIEMIKAKGTLPADLDVTATARSVFMNLGRSGWEAICCYHRGLAPLLKRCHIKEGQEYIEAALAENQVTGQGIILLTGHIGSWEIMCHYVAQAFNFKLTIIGRNTGNWAVDTFIHKLRTSTGNKYVGKHGAAKVLFTALRAGGILGIMLDQATMRTIPSPKLPFLGMEANVNVDPLKVAHRIGAQVLVVLSHREGSKNYVSFYPAIKILPHTPEDQAVLAVAKQYNEILEAYIKRYPDQWMWGHRRWKMSRLAQAKSPTPPQAPL